MLNAQDGPRMRKVEFIDHTGDMGVRVYGESLSLLFQHAGEALFRILTNPRMIREKDSRKVFLRAHGLEELLISWLNELIYLFDTDGFLFRRFEILELSEQLIEAMGYGERYEEGHHPILRTVKAATYHQLQVTRENDVWKAQIIFDL